MVLVLETVVQELRSTMQPGLRTKERPVSSQSRLRAKVMTASAARLINRLRAEMHA